MSQYRWVTEECERWWLLLEEISRLSYPLQLAELDALYELTNQRLEEFMGHENTLNWNDLRWAVRFAIPSFLAYVHTVVKEGHNDYAHNIPPLVKQVQHHLQKIYPYFSQELIARGDEVPQSVMEQLFAR